MCVYTCIHVGKARIFKPRRMRKGYGNHCVCVSVTTLAATYVVYMSKARRHTVSCRLLKVCIVWTLLKMFRSGDMASFACHDDRRLGSFLTKTHQWFLTRLQMVQYMKG